MSIQISCSVCGTSYNVNPTVIGKRLKCKDCGQAFVATTSQPLPTNVPPPLPPPIPIARTAHFAPPPLPVIPITADSQDAGAAPVSLINWLLGVNLFEQISVGVSIGLMVIALLIGGDIGMVIGGVISTLILLYFAFAAYLMARTAGRNGYGIVQMLIPFYIIPFSIGHWPVMKWPVARMARVGGLIVLVVLVFIRTGTDGGKLGQRGSIASANNVRGGNLSSVAVTPKPPKKSPPRATPGGNGNSSVSPPPVMVEKPSAADKSADSLARAEEARRQAEARRLALLNDPNAPPVPIEAAIAGPVRPPNPNRNFKNPPSTVIVGPMRLTVPEARVSSAGRSKDWGFYRFTPTGQDTSFQIYAESSKEDANGATVPKLEPGSIVGRQPKFTLGESSQIDQVEINDKTFTRVRENNVDRCYSGYINGYRITIFYAGPTSTTAGQSLRLMLETMQPVNTPR